MTMLIILFGGLIVWVGTWVVVRRLRLRQLRLRRQREGFGRESFIKAFRNDAIPDDIPAAVYEYYGSRKGWKAFPFAPEDEYSTVLYDDQDDIDHDAVDLIERLKLRMPLESILRQCTREPIRTLRDMVLWLDWIREHQ